jgi:phosphoglycerate dehydrogenase-like enzyme
VRSAQEIVSPTNPTELDKLKATASDIDKVQSRREAEAIEQASGAAACYGFITRELIREGKSLRWVQQPSAGVEGLMEIRELVEGDIFLTNMQRVYAPEIADQAIGYLLTFTRSLAHFIRAQPGQEWQ